MSGYGYPQNPPGHGYGYAGAPPPPQPYGSQPPYGAPPHGGADGGAKPPKENKPPYGAADHGHGYPSPAYGSPSGQPYGQPPYGASVKPPKENKPYGGGDQGHGYPSAPSQPYGGGDHGHGYPSPAHGPPSGQPQYGPGPGQPYGGDHGHGYPPAANPFAAVLPSTFPPGTDPSVIACFQVADNDGSGLIDDKELQRALSSYNQSFSLRTVHLLMYSFTNSNSRKIGPKEFVSLYYSLQSWREIFERFDRDRSGKIDASELRDALYSLGFSVSPVILDLLVSKFDKTGGKSRAIEYDNFIECCLTVKGLTEKFKAKDKAYTGTATFTYEDFMLTVLPFLVA